MMTVHVEQSVSAHLVQRCSSSLGESHATQHPMAEPESPVLVGSKTLCGHWCRNWRYVCDGRGGEAEREGARGTGGAVGGCAAGAAWGDFKLGRPCGSCVSAITATAAAALPYSGTRYEWEAGGVMCAPLWLVEPSGGRIWAKGDCPFLVRFG